MISEFAGDSLLRDLPTVAGFPRVGPCLVLAKLGEGARSRVYHAWHGGLGLEVALKCLLLPTHMDAEQQEKTLRRFQREAELGGEVQHTNLAQVLDSGTYRDIHYISIELLRGGTVEELVEQEPLTPERAARVVLHAARGVAEIHASEHVHRDIKPANLLVGVDGIVRVGDFGLMRETEGGAAITMEADFVGTPAFAAPEHMQAAKDAKPPADVYSLGVTLRFLVLGRDRFAADYRQHPKGLPDGIDAILRRCTDDDPDARYANAGELARALAEQVEERPLQAIPVRIPGRAPDPEAIAELQEALGSDAHEYGEAAGLSRAPWLVGGGVLLVLIFVGVVAQSWGGHPLWGGSGRERPPWLPDEFEVADPELIQDGDRQFPTAIRHRLTEVELVYARGGSFEFLGNVPDPQGLLTEPSRPAAPMTLAGFYIARTELSELQYVLGRQELPERKRTDMPVRGLRFTDAEEWCSQNRMAIPTEAQWEYAASGPDDRAYPWGNSWRLDLVHIAIRRQHPRTGADVPRERILEVDTLPDDSKSWCGAVGMAGNVAEYCIPAGDLLVLSEPVVHVRPQVVLRGGSSTVFQPRARVEFHTAAHERIAANVDDFAAAGVRPVFVPELDDR